MSSTQQVLQAVLTSSSVTATQEQRRAAQHLFEQLKAGDVRASAAVATELIGPQQPLEAQVLGYTLLQHLVGARWDEFSSEEHSQVGTLAYNMLKQAGGASYAVKSKASLLLALVIKRSGHELWDAALPQLLAAAATEGPAMQEQVSMVIKYVADEVTLYSEDLSGEPKRLLLASLTKSLDHVLPFLEKAIENNYQAAAAAAQAGGGPAAAAPHVAAIHAGLQAAHTYGDWAPVGKLKEAGLVHACGFLLSTPDFREEACDVLRAIAGRKQAEEVPETFRAVMEAIAEALCSAAAPLLASPAALQELSFEGMHDEFGQTLCDTMTLLGSAQLAAITSVDKRNAFLQHMLTFAQHPYLLLADKALPFWSKVLQDAAVSTGHAAAASASAPRQATIPLPPEAVAALMDLAAEQLQTRSSHTPQDEDNMPPYFDSFAEYKEFMIGYRAKLSAIVRSAAAVLPEQALAAAARRLDAAAAAAAEGGGVPLERARVLLESAVYFMESTFKAVWGDPATAEQPARQAAVVAATEPMLQRLLALRVSAGDAALLSHQARGLESFGRLLAVRRDLVGPALTRLFELLTSVVPLEGPGQQPPPSKPPPGWREGLNARQNVTVVLLTWTKVCPEALLPHLEPLATRVKELWEQGLIRAGEKNVLSEAMLGASCAGPETLQATVAEWLLAPVRGDWGGAAFQATVATPEAFIRQYMPPESDGAGGSQVGGSAARWVLYHEINVMERAVRRMQQGGSPASHPLAPHLEWAIPCMMQVLSCLHAVYTPAGRQLLGPLEAALEISPQERAFYLKQGPPGRNRAFSDDGSDGDYSSVGGSSLGSLRGWMRHVREYCYQTVGLLPTHCPAVMASPTTAAAFQQHIFAYVDALGPQQVRIIMRHVLTPHVRGCPPAHLGLWVLPALQKLVPHMHARLSAAWAAMMAAAAARTEESAADEIIRDRLVRELTQEYADLLKGLAARTLEEPGAAAAAAGAAAVPPGSPGGVAAGTGGRSLLQWLLETDPATGFAAATTAVLGMQWSDPAAYGFAMFGKALVGMAPRDPGLYQFVGTEVLRAAITSLASETLSVHQSDILSLIREVLVQQLSGPAAAISPAHGVLASLPNMGGPAVEKFRNQLLKLNSEKSQRDAIKRMLISACGRQSFAALAEWKPPAATTVTTRSKVARPVPGADPEDEHFSSQVAAHLFG